MNQKDDIEDMGTLYCSFCGKSQHEVTKLIAGPTVFICDECVDLCDDIIIEETHGDRIIVRVNIPKTTDFDDALFAVLAASLAETIPGSDFKFEYRGIKERVSEKSQLAVFSFDKVYGDDSESKVKQEEYARLKYALASSLNEISVLNERFVHQSERAKSLQLELEQIKLEYLDYLRDNAKKASGKTVLRVVMFLDIAGFSQFEFHRKRRVVDMLRGITPPLLSDRGATQVNMWGDAIVANFSDVNQSVECAVKFIRHLSVEHLDARIGMSWGEIRIKPNIATGLDDIDGPVVDFAARIEAMAPIGGIILSPQFLALNLDPAIGELIPIKLPVKKAFAGYAVGDDLDLLQLRVRMN